MMKSTSQGRLFLVSLLGFFCTGSAWSPVLLSLVTVVILLDVGRRVTSYNTQDLINILVMYSALVCLQSHQTSSLWLTVFCLSPAQLLRSVQVKIFSTRESLFQEALLAQRPSPASPRVPGSGLHPPLHHCSSPSAVLPHLPPLPPLPPLFPHRPHLSLSGRDPLQT